jgi:hypothetical protein
MRSTTPAARPTDLLHELRRRARAGDAAAKWMLRLLARGETAPPAAAGDDAPKK